jgi:hypothetical protein
MKHVLSLLSFALLLLVGQSVQGQPPMPPDDGKPFERIEHFKKIRLIEMLDMKEEQSVRFFARLNEHDKAKRDLTKEKMDVLDKIERLVRNHAEGKEFQMLFPDVIASNEKILLEDQKFFDSLSDILSPEQRGKYLLFERQFEREIREAMRDIQRRRMRMGQQ